MAGSTLKFDMCGAEPLRNRNGVFAFRDPPADPSTPWACLR